MTSCFYCLLHTTMLNQGKTCCKATPDKSASTKKLGNELNVSPVKVVRLDNSGFQLHFVVFLERLVDIL